MKLPPIQFHRALWSLILIAIIIAIALGQCQDAKAKPIRPREVVAVAVAVPEPATYGVLGAITLISVVLVRRFKK